MELHPLGEGLTFDDILLVPAASEVLPRTTDLAARLTARIDLRIPLLSAAMDTVTESRTAIAMAQEGGLGFVHKNLSVERQAAEVALVKKYESGMVADPLTVAPDQTLAEALATMQKARISGLPVTENGKLVGILTNRDLRFERRLDRPVREVMTRENLVTAKPGVTLDEATRRLHEHRIEKLLVVDDERRLLGLITVKDIDKATLFPHACRDRHGRLRVGAAVGVGADWEQRAAALIEAGADVICVDTAHGHSKNVLETVKAIKRRYSDLDVVAGNVGTGDGAKALIDAGADAVKVGMGVGSICTTRIISGVGMPQVTAIVDAARVARDRKIPVIADGGIRFSGDAVKALACGAHAVMIGSLFAGTEESPGETILYQGRTYKMYRGMGSLEAMRAGSRDRYFQDDEEEAMKLVPEGIEGRVPYKGSLSSNLHQLVGGIRAGMGYLGCRTLDELRERSRYIRISEAGHRESHVHDVVVAKEAPNYRLG
ncbi:MAG: IMP dehydrogenase [Deltaproteobacteria bacterium]|nr:IMP dehydrogenase [Deltaproteobacteria bacterium]